MKRKSQSDHDEMVQRVADTLVKEKYKNVKADIKGYDTPRKITWKKTGNGHIPDVTGEDENKVIIEVETEDSINDQHTEDQWKLFSAYAKEYKVDFFIYVPGGSEKEAEERLKELKITGKVKGI